jgi:hypothetical protein
MHMVIHVFDWVVRRRNPQFTSINSESVQLNSSIDTGDPHRLTLPNVKVRLAIIIKLIFIIKLRPFECRYVQYVPLSVMREKAVRTAIPHFELEGKVGIYVFFLLGSADVTRCGSTVRFTDRMTYVLQNRWQSAGGSL